MKSFLFGAIGDILILGIFYLFLCFCNWSLYPMEWHGFARFLMGFAILLYFVELLNDYSKLKNKL
jgi:membrane-bound ClpP family serine protease